MAGFLDCIDGAVKAGDVDADVAAEIRETYDDALAQASETLAPADAERIAADAVLGEMEAKALRDKQLRALATGSRRRVLEGVAQYKRARGYTGVQALGGGGAKPPKDGWVQGGKPPADGPGSQGAMAARALELLVENKPGLGGAPFPSIEGRYRAIRGQFDARMAQVIETFETRTGMDAPNPAVLENVVREAFGQETGDRAAKELAKGWGEAADLARQMFNAAGGAIGKIDNWGLPQYHDPLAVRRAGKAAWVEAVLPRLDMGKMTDRVTGLPFGERRLRAVLGDTWEKIATGGLSEKRPGEHPGKGRLADRRSDSRFMVFKSADDWMAYQADFGAGDPFGIMMGHLDEMARDIAQMQILGPNPQAQFDWLANFAEREAAMELAAGVEGAARGKTYLRQARNMLDHFTGSANVPERDWLAIAGATTRSWVTGAVLGSAVISEIPSGPVFGAYARAFSGAPKVGEMSELVKQLALPANRAAARRAGFIVEQATDGVVQGVRDSLRLETVGAQVDGRGLNAFSRRLPSTVFRVTGLTGLTSARKRTFRFEMMGALADRRDMTLAQIAGSADAEDKAFADLLKARGFTPADWNAIRAAPLWEPSEGAAFLRPLEVIETAGEDLGLRLAEMIEMQTRMAVPETTLWTRAKLIGNNKPGTFQGEFMRSWAMFRSFSLTATYLFGEEFVLRSARTARPGMALAGYGVGILAALTLAGGLTIQARQIVQGNDPRDMRDPKFWGAALTQGGGLGILGDLFYATETRAGKSAAMTSWGPAAALAADAWNLTGGNVMEVAAGLGEGEDLGEAVEGAKIGRDAVRFAGRYAPWASIWWARTAWDRMVMDQLQKVVDPEADEDFARQVRRMEREYGQGQWWPQGEVLPERAPELAGAVGE